MGRILALALVPFLLAALITAKTLNIGPFANTLICANSISCINDLSGKYDPTTTKAIWMARNVATPTELAQSQEEQVLGQSTGENKHIYVDLTNQHLYAYQNSKLVMDFPVSTGKWRITPTGDYKIWIKLRYTRMTGGEGADYYDLPNVPYVMFFYNNDVPEAAGFSLHGAYWHNNFGHPMSHGCVNISPENAGKLFAWADPPTNGPSTPTTSDSPGTLVTIYGTTPEN